MLNIIPFVAIAWPRGRMVGSMLLAVVFLLVACQPGGSNGQATSASNVPAMSEAAAAAPGGQLDMTPADWVSTSRTAGGISYTFSRPPAWSDDLSFCTDKVRPDATKGFGLPAGCAVTDLLVGSKAAQVGQLTGDPITTLDGHHAVRHIDDHLPGGLAASIYTMLVYDASGAPVLGFNTSIGVGTGPAEQEVITSTLDSIFSTLSVGTTQ